MRRAIATPAVLTAVAVALLLVGCVPQQPLPVPTTTPTVTPVFASDAEALAAAKKAYEGYNDVSDAIARDGGAKPERILPYVTGSMVRVELDGSALLRRLHEHLDGATTFRFLNLQSNRLSPAGVATVTVYACLDVSETKVVDSAGRDITPPSRRSVLPLEVGFRSSSTNRSILKLERSDPWSGDDYC